MLAPAQSPSLGALIVGEERADAAAQNRHGLAEPHAHRADPGRDHEGHWDVREGGLPAHVHRSSPIQRPHGQDDATCVHQHSPRVPKFEFMPKPINDELQSLHRENSANLHRHHFA